MTDRGFSARGIGRDEPTPGLAVEYLKTWTQVAQKGLAELACYSGIRHVLQNAVDPRSRRQIQTALIASVIDGTGPRRELITLRLEGLGKAAQAAEATRKPRRGERRPTEQELGERSLLAASLAAHLDHHGSPRGEAGKGPEGSERE